jgi:hypothetical protein
MEKPGCHLTKFREILCWGFLVNSVDQSKISLKTDKNNRHLTGRLRAFIFRCLRDKYTKYSIARGAEETVDDLKRNIAPRRCDLLAV